MRRQLMLGLMIVTVVAAPLSAVERSPKVPATRPASQANSLKRLLRDLASDDAAVRDAARVALMGLKRTDIPALQTAVADSLPLEPSQNPALPDIVMHL